MPPLKVALDHHQAGRFAVAEAIYRQVLEAQPKHPDALHFLGMLAHDLGRNLEAIELIERAHRYMRPQAFSLNNLGVAYLASDRPREARRCFTKALALKPDHAEAHSNLGDALDALGELREAERSYRRSLALKPDRAIAHYSLGNLLHRLGRRADAERSYREALIHGPELAPAWHNLGIVVAEQGRLDDAAQCYREALRIDPRHAPAHHHLGVAQQALGRLVEAEQSYRDCVALAPERAEVRLDLGNVLQALERDDEAERVWREALALRPDFAEAHFNLGNLLGSLDRHDEAVDAYRRAIALKPEYAAARWALAMSYPPIVPESGEQADGARATFAAELETLIGWFGSRLADDERAIVAHPFRLAYQERGNRDLLARYGALAAGIMRGWQAREATAPIGSATPVRIRVGVVSAHVYAQSVFTAIVKGWLECLDRDRFELDVFHVGHRQDHATAFAAARATHFEQGPRTTREWAAAIGARQPDLLIYPEIGMNVDTIKLAALRLAPVQVASWGHPETTGLPTLDYYLSAELLEPASADSHYSERLVTLPNLGCYFASTKVDPVAPDLARLGIDARSPLLVCAGTPFKYAPEHDWVLPAIAAALGDCQFVFFRYRVAGLSEKLHRRLSGAFAQSGLEPDRYLRCIPWQAAPQFYGLMERADVFLDTIGFSGFNTAMQAVECALPIVTREGRFMRGRLASGVLKRIGLDELIVASENDYVALAVKLVRDAAYRARMSERIAASREVLYRDETPIRALEAFLASVAGR